MVMSCGKVMCCALPSSSPASSLFLASFLTAPRLLLSPVFLFLLVPFFFVSYHLPHRVSVLVTGCTGYSGGSVDMTWY